MGVKDLWSILTPYAERKPICELRGKTVAIDLAGWVCESLNVVDYFVHPKHHLKNLFFRTCFLIWEEVTPVFVLEGKAPELKSQVIAKRNELQFRGVKPKHKDKPEKALSQQSQESGAAAKGRTRFNHVLKQCELLLQTLGIQCIQGPGEAEAYCAFLNKNGLVDGIISQDSDCFAYGALRVYRNFSVSTQGALMAQGGSVDIYDMSTICQKMDFGQHKIIVMALLCGCDYCPDGVGGVGRDSVLKLFNKYGEKEILDKVRFWRHEDSKYNAQEMRVDDKNVCANCGHMGRTQSHTKSGCGVCRTGRGCDESLWKEQRLSIKAELALRKKALLDPTFPCEEVINEFLTDPPVLPNLKLNWQQPKIVKFIKQVGRWLQWQEIYAFQKIFPILTRWQVRNVNQLTSALVEPKEIIKKRVLKGVPSLELVWRDTQNMFQGLIPDEQIEEFMLNHPKGIQELWSTVEPLGMLEQAYPAIVASFLKSKEKPKKAPKIGGTRGRKKKTDANSSLNDMNDLIKATNDIAKNVRAKKVNKKQAVPKGVQPIDKFLKRKLKTPPKANKSPAPPAPVHRRLLSLRQCSTPITKSVPSELESEAECDEAFDMSDIINKMVGKSTPRFDLEQHEGRRLYYEPVTQSNNIPVCRKKYDFGNCHSIKTDKPTMQNLDDFEDFDVDFHIAHHSMHKVNFNIFQADLDNRELSMAHNANSTTHKMSVDDLDLLIEKRQLSINESYKDLQSPKRAFLDDSFDVLVNKGKRRLTAVGMSTPLATHVDRFKVTNRVSSHLKDFQKHNSSKTNLGANNVSGFFNHTHHHSDGEQDAFELIMEQSLGKQAEQDMDLIVLDSSSEEENS